MFLFFFFSSRRRHTRYIGDWSSDVCSSDLTSPDAKNACPQIGYPYLGTSIFRVWGSYYPFSYFLLIGLWGNLVESLHAGKYSIVYIDSRMNKQDVLVKSY